MRRAGLPFLGFCFLLTSLYSFLIGCLLLCSVTGRTVQANGQTYLNFAATNFLGLADKPHIKVSGAHTRDILFLLRPLHFLFVLTTASHPAITPPLSLLSLLSNVLLIAAPDCGFGHSDGAVTKDTNIVLFFCFTPSILVSASFVLCEDTSVLSE